MIRHKTTYRIIYGDTDRMGVAYYANYLRWFEIGRTEMFRSLGMPYRDIEDKGFFLPVSEVFCKFKTGSGYDDLLVIETSLDETVRAGMKFDYRISGDACGREIATGYTKHAFTDRGGKVVRPPGFLRDLIKKNSPAGEGRDRS